MGKKLRQQRAGKGSPTFISPSWRKVAPPKYPLWLFKLIDATNVTYKGIVKNILSESGRDSPLCLIKLENGKEFFSLAVEGIFKSQEFQIGKKIYPKVGNISQIGSLPEGTIICNIERRPGDGGKIARTAGSYATIVSQSPSGTIINLPSGKMIELNKRCLATIGLIAGGGKIEKPLLKAGKMYHISKSKAFKWPIVRGKAMYAASHPHGGGSHPSGGRPVKRISPPGKKTGFYGSKRTGKKKR